MFMNLGNYFLKLKKKKDLVENNFIESFNESSNVVSDKNLNRIDMNVEGFQDIIYSNSSENLLMEVIF